MIIKLKKSLGTTIGLKRLAGATGFGLDEDAWKWKDYAEIDLRRLSEKKLALLDKLLAEHQTVHGVGVLRKDIATWQAALTDAGTQKARTCKQFESLLIRYLAPLPHHHVYERLDNGVWQPYVVDGVHYHPEQRDHGNYTPAFVQVCLIWEEFGGTKKRYVHFEESDCRNITVREACARKKLYPETTELRDAHLALVSRFSDIVDKVGAQFLATGTATDDLDGNPRTYGHERYLMERNEAPSRVVIDVFRETEKEGHNREASPDVWFWRNHYHKGKLKTDDEEIDGDSEETSPEVEVPIHPMLAVFDLVRHLRLRIHVSYLTEYIYDTKLADKLILPREMKELVTLLVAKQEAAFQDIVKGKSGGAVILLAGKPGVGKTLTAEVYAESTSRALYSVQCSQLGIVPEKLEEQLLKVFARAARWDAVLLLDEADVYVHERGRDLMQNAIVGVFLRVLEYQDALLFLTTNRPEDVDDAIASRCIARLTYPIPTPGDQCWIWQILAALSGIPLPAETIVEIVQQNQTLTGRDVKNLLKLARLTPPPITAQTIAFVKRFKPTGDA
jgi:hypothetical protein